MDWAGLLTSLLSYTAFITRNELNPTRDGSRNSGRKYRGVRSTRSGRWSAKIEKKGLKRICIGTYDSAVEAACAYDRMARILHGAKAILNFPYHHIDDNSFPATDSTLPKETSVFRGLASGSAFANILGEQSVLESVGSAVRTTGSGIGSSGSTTRTLNDNIPVASKAGLPVEISDSTVPDANTDVKPQTLTDVPLNDFGVSEEFFDNMWN